MAVVTHSVLDPNRPVLPEWTRWAWASLVERDYWLPLFEKASAAREEIEWLTVIEGLRPAMYTFVAPDQLVNVNQRAAKHGLVVVPIAQQNRNPQHSYTSGSSGSLNLSQPWEYRVLITHPDMLPLISRTPNLAQNNEVLGEVLGYPTCCREFFHRTWGAGQVDTTWDQYASTGNADGPLEANMLWRWWSIRWVSHLPCSFQCQATIDLGRKTREIAKKHGLVEEAKIIDTILSWPVKWSGVNGIAEIVGPAIKISTRTDWAPPTDNRQFERRGRYAKPNEDLWKHNGFSSYRAMDESHKPLIDEIVALVPERGTIVDLGCGNGRLLRTAKLHRPDIRVGGVDVNAEAIQSAHASMVGGWSAAKIEDMTWKYLITDTAVLLYSPVRLTEMSESDRTRVREALSAHPTHLVYVYGDNLQRRSLEEWVIAAGLPVDKLTVVCNETASPVAIGILHLNR